MRIKLPFISGLPFVDSSAVPKLLGVKSKLPVFISRVLFKAVWVLNPFKLMLVRTTSLVFDLQRRIFMSLETHFLQVGSNVREHRVRQFSIITCSPFGILTQRLSHSSPGP